MNSLKRQGGDDLDIGQRMWKMELPRPQRKFVDVVKEDMKEEDQL